MKLWFLKFNTFIAIKFVKIMSLILELSYLYVMLDFLCNFRYSRFDKAFLLAVDINARDLFMDIYYAALDAGQQRIAAAARHKASLCDDELMFSGE